MTLRQPGSKLALLQTVMVLATLLLAVLWVVYWWPTSPQTASVGAAMMMLGYAGGLAIEFGMAWLIHRQQLDSQSLSLGAWWGAWWQEVRVSPKVFSWRQPFRWRSSPDDLAPRQGQTAVVLVHGFVCNRGFWLPWMRALRTRGVPYTSVNLEPVFGSIDSYIDGVEEAVRRAEVLTGCPPVLICHSMGGLAARAWLAAIPGATQRVAQVVTIGTPHHGTWLARFSHTLNGQQMRLNSTWLANLRAREAAARPDGYPDFVCWYSDTDNIVFPAATACLPGAHIRRVTGTAHVALAFHPTVMAQTLASLDRINRPFDQALSTPRRT